MSIFSSMMVMMMVKIIEMARVSWVVSGDRAFWPSCPRLAPSVVIKIFPRNIAKQNFAGLYFMSPRGIMTGSSGIGVADAMNRARKAHFPTFRFTSLRRSLRFSLRRPPAKKVTR